MNLGLEDAFVFAELVRTGQLSAYDRLRRPVDRSVVRRVEFLSQIASAESRFYRFVRSFVLLKALKIPCIHARMVAAVTGLDHALPRVLPA
jgi:2-polyprenyl-6-methoxyphenol hydroxylase-like FAD-dependent oxidoreductase